MRASFRAVLISSLAMGGGCNPAALDGPGACAPDHRAIDLTARQNRARWNALGASTYDYTFERICFCPTEVRGPFRVRVENGAVVRSEPPAPASFPSTVLTIPQAFDLIEDAVDRDACSISVRYDVATGVPTDVFVDYVTLLADEEQGFRFSDVTIPR